ncbi:MAG: hypothetical protein JWL81_162, partial [Verrucomicrobiales bacterium]|nr:hypothetical protein [Verrucomicrobiales bacterium]
PSNFHFPMTSPHTPHSPSPSPIQDSDPATHRHAGSKGKWTALLVVLGLGVILAATPGLRCGSQSLTDPRKSDAAAAADLRKLLPGWPGNDSAAKVPEGAESKLRQRLESLTGNHTRLVWSRDLGPAKDTFANGGQLVLMGLDTRETSGQRMLESTPGNYSRPLFTPDGQSVIYSRRISTGDPATATWTSSIFVRKWNNGPALELRPGYAVEVWQDPATSKTWIYALTTMRPAFSSNPEGYRLFRFPMEAPDKEEVVWEQGMISGDNIQLNRAGTFASGLIPWPNAGTFDFKSGQFIRYRNGCWPSLAPDDSGLLWVFDGTHENLRMFLPGIDANWRVPMGELEGLKGKACYHPRWSNHPRLMCFTGPHPLKVNEGSGKVSVLIARFNDSLTKFEDSVNLHNTSGRPDCYPDLWISGGETANLDLAKIGPKRVRELAAAPPAKPTTLWAAKPEGLAFVWERATKNNAIPGSTRTCSVTPRRYARFGNESDMLIQGGVFEMDPDSAAAARKTFASGPWSMELAVTPTTTGNEIPQVIFRAGPDFELQQSHHDFIVRVGGRDWQIGAGLSPENTTHLAMGGSGKAGELPLAWINGQSQDIRPVEVEMRRALAPSDSPEVQFGARAGNTSAWTGRLECIAINARPFDPALAAAHAAWWKETLTHRVPPRRTVVRARLLEASTRATPDSIGAYNRAWTSALYQKTSLVSGPDPGEKFGVAHWTIMDKTPLDGPPGKPGDERELLLESMTDHPEMESEFGTDEILAPDQPVFLDVAPL